MFDFDRQFENIIKSLKYDTGRYVIIVGILFFICCISIFIGAIALCLGFGSGYLYYPGLLAVIGGGLGISVLSDYCDSKEEWKN